MADGLDVVAVRVASERVVVLLVVLRPQARLVQHLGAGTDGRLEERPYRSQVRGAEGDGVRAEVEREAERVARARGRASATVVEAALVV